MLQSLYNWMGNCVYSRYSQLILALVFYLEAILLLPVEPMLMFYCYQRPEHKWRYAAIATGAAVAGALTSYALGYFLWHSVGEQLIHSSFFSYLIKPETFNKLRGLFVKHEWLTLLTAGIPPIPFKAATLTAGFCRLSIIPFIICSFIVRGVRFFGVMYVTGYCNAKTLATLKKYRYLALASCATALIALCMYLN